MNKLSRLALGACIAAALAAVSLSYLNPHVVLDLANRVWSCF